MITKCIQMKKLSSDLTEHPHITGRGRPIPVLVLLLIPVLSVRFFANTDIKTPKLKLNDSRNFTVISVMIVLNNCTI